MRKLVAVLVMLGCGGKDVVLGPTDQGQLRSTLDALAAMGQKQAGTPAGQQAAQYISDRFAALELTDVHLEPFQFPRWELISKSMTISIDGVDLTPGFDVFEASGSGIVDGEIVNVETATDGELAGKDLTGKIALVVRDPSFHRSSQYRNVQQAHAAAMLYLSIAPDNLRQVGSTRLDWEAAGTIPAITIGADDGAMVRDAVLAGKAVRANINVAIQSTPGTGTNVVAKVPGERPETIVLGAHFDSWFTGSSDNGSGVAELLAVAERRKLRGKPRYTLVFVAFDGEEIGLYGGYDYLRKHKTVAGEPVVAVINFESPSANDPEIAGLVHSNQPALDEALQAAHLRQLYGVYAGLEVVAMLFGGIIPTDIQGVYRSGVPTVTTAVTNAYYHTVDDTPDKVDLRLLADSSDAFDAALDFIMHNEPAVYEQPDRKLWTTEVTTTEGAMFMVDATFQDGDGAAGAGAVATAAILVDDFTLAATVTATTDASGHAVFALPPAALAMGSGNRFLHVTAGPTYPLVEKIIPLP
jgi:Zn-dependent M28 family amino/carboxypeptidase